MPLLAHTLVPWLRVFDRLTVVLQPGSENLLQVVATVLPDALGRIAWVATPSAERGMGASLAAGVATRLDAGGWLIGLADMPLLPSTVIRQVRQAIIEGAMLTAPFCREQRGHPVGFAVCYGQQLLALDGDQGARSLIERDLHQLTRIETNDRGVLMDIDTQTDLLLLKT